MEWIVVTPENVNEVFKQLEEKNTDLVLFAITDDGYEMLASDMVLLRNYIAQQRLIIMKYKDYYEPEQKDTK
jgi:mannitol-1-phosphate/altronate dehydrogenase